MVYRGFGCGFWCGLAFGLKGSEAADQDSNPQVQGLVFRV